MGKDRIIGVLRSYGLVNPEPPPPQPDFMQGVKLPQYYANGRRKLFGFDRIRPDDETTQGINQEWLATWVRHARGVHTDRGQRATTVLGDSLPDGIGSLSGIEEIKNTNFSPSDDDIPRIVSRLSEPSASDLERNMLSLRASLETARDDNRSALASLRSEMASEGNVDVLESTREIRVRRNVRGMILALRRGREKIREKAIRTIEEMKAREGVEVSAGELFGAAVASYVPTSAERRNQIVADNQALNVPAKTRIRDIFHAIRGHAI